jgi:hypothetical protein
MCYDICLRAIDDTLQTMEGMKYRRVGEEEATENAQAEVLELVEQLGEIRQKLGLYEGAHKDKTVKCNSCNVYHHHDHDKVEWRGESSKGGYDEDVEWAVRKDGARYEMKPSSPYADT